MSVVISEISTAIVRRGHPITKYAALAAGTYVPGSWGYYSATGTVTALASGTPACCLLKPMLIGFEPRVSSTRARKDIDDAIAIATAPIIWGGSTGPLLVSAVCEDPVGDVLRGTGMMTSNTAGCIEILVSGLAPAGGVCGPGHIIVWEDLITADEVGIFLYS